MDKIVKDITGQKFNRFTVIKTVGLNEKGRLWECKCDCGNIKILNTSVICFGSTKSCGCLHKETVKQNIQKAIEHNKLPYLETEFRWLYRDYKRYHPRRNFEFNIDYEVFKVLVKQNCYYCGKEPSQRLHWLQNVLYYNGLDRVDNNEGYTIDNVVTCCRDCNYGKRSLSKEDFINQAKRIAKLHPILLEKV